MEKEIIKIENEVSPIIDQAKTIKVVNGKSMTEAVIMLSNLNKQNDRITNEKEKVTKPLNEALKAERARWKPIETILTSAIEALRASITAYQTEETKRVRAEEAKIASRIKEGKGNLSFETGIKKIDAIEKPQESVETEAGKIKFREDKVLKITDRKLIPDRYLVVDEKLLLADLKAGKTIKGAELEVVMIPLNYR